MCVDGTQTHTRHKALDQYKKQIQELIERGFRPYQISLKLHEMFPGISFKRSTLNDYCLKLREELYDTVQSPHEEVFVLSEGSILQPFISKIQSMLDEDESITSVFTEIIANGYTGSYSLLQQTCQKMKPKTYEIKKTVRKIKRKDITGAIWTGESDFTPQDVEHIRLKFPVLDEIERIISEFRTAYSKKDVAAVHAWCVKYEQSQFPAICSFINGINADTDAFYNSMIYEYSNGLLEGSVNKLKTVKRTMFGRASYGLLRAKLLLLNCV